MYLTDEQWKKIEPLIPKPPPRPKGGRPRKDNRLVFEGILWILKTGARWKDLPDKYPHPSTCWRRLKEWYETEVRAVFGADLVGQASCLSHFSFPGSSLGMYTGKRPPRLNNIQCGVGRCPSKARTTRVPRPEPGNDIEIATVSRGGNGYCTTSYPGE